MRDDGVWIFRGVAMARPSCGRLCVVFPDEVIEPHLLLQVIFAGRSGGFLLQGKVHALMPAILLRMAWLDAFDGDAESEPPDREFREIVEPVGTGKRDAIGNR
nr:hypothetical protein [Hyphomonas sp. BRH_c22]